MQNWSHHHNIIQQDVNGLCWVVGVHLMTYQPGEVWVVCFVFVSSWLQFRIFPPTFLRKSLFICLRLPIFSPFFSTSTHISCDISFISFYFFTNIHPLVRNPLHDAVMLMCYLLNFYISVFLNLHLNFCSFCLIDFVGVCVQLTFVFFFLYSDMITSPSPLIWSINLYIHRFSSSSCVFTPPHFSTHTLAKSSKLFHFHFFVWDFERSWFMDIYGRVFMFFQSPWLQKVFPKLTVFPPIFVHAGKPSVVYRLHEVTVIPWWVEQVTSASRSRTTRKTTSFFP